MIKRLSVRNFRSNKRLDIDLDPHVTCITGESYQGKSNAVRAIKWAALNRPSGTRFISWGAKQSIVTIERSDGKKVVRKRGKSINSYVVDGHTLKAFGNDVPNKVKRFLNLSEINFQIQQEIPHGDGPLFWFALTSGQVSKRLNRIVNLDVIDRTLGNLQTVIHKAKSTLDVCWERRTEAKEQAEALAFVGEMSQEWEDVQKAQKRFEDAKQDAEELEDLLSEILPLQETLKTSKQSIDGMDMDLAELETLRGTIIEVSKQQEALSLLLSEISRLERERTEALEELVQSEKDYTKALGVRCPLCHNKILKNGKKFIDSRYGLQ